MSEEDRFKDNEDGTLTDTKYNLMWMKQDYYQHKGKWCSWKKANKYVEKLNEEPFAGYSDWRLPKNQECRNLYDHECKNSDFDGDIVHLDYKFPEGCGFTYWTCEENGLNATAYNFYSDRGYPVRKKTSDEGNMTCRAVRSSGPKVDKTGRTSLSGRSRKD